MTRARSLEILTEDERLWAAREARRFAAELGFSRTDQARLAVCVAELASNAVKYAGCGRIELTEIAPEETPGHDPLAEARAPAESAPGLRLRARDHGPGILIVADSLRDGFSEGRWLTPDVPLRERRGLGIGLGTVCRLMSDVRVSSPAGGGLEIEAVLWQSPGPSSTTERR